MHRWTLKNLATCSLLLPAAFVAYGCGGTEVREPAALPFHVAVVPTEVLEPEESPPGETPQDVLEIKLELESESVSAAIHEVLRDRCFARVTLLPYPESKDEFLKGDEEERIQHWLREAKNCGADILMTSRLGYSSAIESSRNEKFWLNLPLFLLGGPFSYFVEDRSYFLDAKMDVILYDLTFELKTLDEGNAEMLDQSIRAEFRETSLNLADRAGADAWAYFVSIVVPAGFLCTENERVKSKLARAAIDGLSEDLLAKIRGETSRLNANRNLSSFCLDLDRVELARQEHGEIRLSIPIRRLFGSRGVSDYEIQGEGIPTVSGAFRSDPDREGLHWIRETLRAPSDARWIRVRVGDVQARARAYTFRLDGAETAE